MYPSGIAFSTHHLAPTVCMKSWPRGGGTHRWVPQLGACSPVVVEGMCEGARPLQHEGLKGAAWHRGCRRGAGGTHARPNPSPPPGASKHSTRPRMCRESIFVLWFFQTSPTWSERAQVRVRSFWRECRLGFRILYGCILVRERRFQGSTYGLGLELEQFCERYG